MRHALATLVVASVGALALSAGIAGADTTGPIDFESYAAGSIDNQNGWSKTGPYDANVVAVSGYPAAAGYGFGSQALQISDATTSGSFGDQTFSPGLAQAAGETGLRHLDASFEIGTALATEQPGLHLSVSPDSGEGSRMSYLRFEDQSDGVHVFFDDANDAGPLGAGATFNERDIATLSRTQAHTIRFHIDFNPGPANDVVEISIDGFPTATGTTWEDYYRYDPEQAGNGNRVPNISKLLFREAGNADSGNAGKGFLIDDVSLASSACVPTGYNGLTAAQIGGDVNRTLDATGCDIGVYYGPTGAGSVNNAEIFGAREYGVVVNGRQTNVTDSSIHDIGDNPFDGVQRGVGVRYQNATGTLSGNTITRYQKNGVVVSGPNAAVEVSGNTVTGAGHIDYIAQNGIQISSGATATVTGNTVSGNWYMPKAWTACGLLFYQAGGVKQSGNTLFDNEINVCNAGRGGGKFNL